MAAAPGDNRRMLMITGDDYGYWPSYNEGILEAVEMGGLDCVSVMVERDTAGGRAETGVESGYIEFEARWGRAAARPPGRCESARRFGDLFGRWPSFLNATSTVTRARSWRRP
jgi:hypothetical protein